MPKLDSELVEHRLILNEGAKLVKQKLRKTLPDKALKVNEEVDKLHRAKVIHVVVYPQWFTNIVLIKKKNGHVRVCVDFRNLNKTCLKDDFPPHNIDILVSHAILFFMDGFSVSNHTRQRSEEKTSFITLWGTYYYVVISFDLENAEDTYFREQ